MEHLVEDHLAEPASAERCQLRALEPGTKERESARAGDALDLDVAHRLLHLLGDVGDLDALVRLDDAHEVLLEERVVQGGEVRADDRVVRELCGRTGAASQGDERDEGESKKRDERDAPALRSRRTRSKSPSERSS